MDGRENAVREIIQLKQSYDKSGQNKENNKQVADKAQQIRREYGLDDSMFGADVSLADTLTNYQRQFGNKQQQQVPIQQEQQVQQPIQDDRPRYDSQQAMQDMQGHFKDTSESFYNSQKAQFDKSLELQLSQLEMAYSEAVENGEISVRDAKAQFDAQKGEIEKSAYQQAESTKAYGNEMGIGHSQQMVGLQQGDNARVNTLNSANMSDRDRRVNDIRDRLNTIKKQKDLSMVSAQTEHGYNLAGASAQANQMYSQQMGELMGKDYSAQMGMQHDIDMNQEQYRQQIERDSTLDRYGKENAQIQQGYNKELKGIDFDNDIFKMTKAQGYTLDNINQEQANMLERLDLGHIQNKEIIGINDANDINKIGINFKNSMTALNTQISANASESAKARNFSKSMASEARKADMEDYAKKFTIQLEADKKKHDFNTSVGLKQFTKGTNEYNLYKAQQDDMWANIANENAVKAVSAYGITSIMENPVLMESYNKPKNWKTETEDSGYVVDPIGSFMNKVTGYNKDKSSYDKLTKEQDEAKKKKEALMRKYGVK